MYNITALDYLPKKVIVFFGNDYWDNKIYLFDYIHEKFNFIKKTKEVSLLIIEIYK